MTLTFVYLRHADFRSNKKCECLRQETRFPLLIDVKIDLK